MTNVTKYWKKVVMPLLLFYVIAVVCRLVSLYVLPRLFPDSCSSIILQLCEGVGPALGGVVVMGIFKKKFFCSIAGKSWIRSLACIVFPTLIFLIFDTHHGLRTSLVFLGCTLYAFLEEVGWRGYLTEELAVMRPIKRILTITVLWFFWHLNFSFNMSGLIFFAILLLASWGLDRFAHDTRSLLLCACAHGIFNLFKHGNGILDNYLTISLLVISILSWFVIWYCPFKKKTTAP